MKKLFTLLVAFHLLILPVKAHAIGGMGQIVGIGVATVGVSLAVGCKLKSPGVLVYMAGAAAYLMGEMNAAKAQKQKLKEEEDSAKKLKDSGVKGGEVQRAALEAQLKSKEEELKLAKKRSMWAMAATAAFTAAAVLSAMEIPPFFPPLFCEVPGTLSMSLPLGAGVVAAYSFMSGGGIMGALSGAVAGAIAAQAGFVNAFNVGPSRSIIMGVTAGLVLLTAMEANGAASKIKKDIDKLKEMIAQFDSETRGKGPNTEDTNIGILAGSSGGVSEGTSSGSELGTLKALPVGVRAAGSTTCLTSNREFSSNCSNPLKLTRPDLKAFGNQLELQKVANQSVEFANAATSGDSERADLAAASLSSMAGRMQDLLKKNRADQNKKLIAAGKKPIDFEKETQDMLKSMQSSYQKETAANQPQLAALGLDKISLDPAKADGSGQDIKAVSATAAIAVPTSTGEAASAVDPALNANAAAASSAELQKAGESAKDALGNNLSEYESTEEDISKNKEDTLWKQVSNRYLLNYQRFFERSKGPAPAQ